MRRGMNSGEMQKNNRMLVFRTLLENGSMTRTELASCIGLQKATITNIINEFLELGIVGIDGATAAGRRGENISLKIDGIYTMSIGISRKDYQIGIFALKGKQVKHIRYLFEKNEDIREVMVKLKRDITALFEQYGKKKIIGICLAVPGLFIRRNNDECGKFQVSEFEQLGQINIRKEIEEAAGIPVVMKHDAKLSAYAEWKNAAEAKEDENASLIAICSKGYGIGAGIIVNQKIVEGQVGIAGEIGHVGINYNGKNNGHGNTGTFEYCAGTESAVRYMLERLYEYPDSMLNEDSTYAEIVEAYKAMDPLAIWAIGKMAWMLGYGISGIVYTINPECVILGRDYPETEDFLKKVREAVMNFVPEEVGEYLSIRYTELSEDSFLLGGYYYVLEKMIRENQILDKIREALS